MKRLALMVDGGCLRAEANRQQPSRSVDPDLIEKVARSCPTADEELFRVLYYDCAPYEGTARLPISGQPHTFNRPGSGRWLADLARRDLFAVRQGKLKFRGWEPKKPGQVATSDSDFRPSFEQKGVDMRIGLDIATYSTNKFVERIALLTADTDMVPALKFARRQGLQIALVQMVGSRKPSEELIAHVDFLRTVAWP